MRGEIFVIDSSPYGRVLLSHSLTHCDDRVTGRDVFCGGSFAGEEAIAIVLRQGVKAVIAHDGGVGKDSAGIAGLALAERHGVPAAAVATFSARVSDAKSLYDGVLSHVNAVARGYGVLLGQAVHTAAWALLQAPPGRAIAIPPSPGDQMHILEERIAGRVVAIWRASLLTSSHPRDVLILGSHLSDLVARQVLVLHPRGVIANDIGCAKDNSAIAGLPLLEQAGIPAATVATLTARPGDALSTWFDGVISAHNAVAAEAGVRTGMAAQEAARKMMGLERE
jgi:hypothetical protein